MNFPTMPYRRYRFSTMMGRPSSSVRGSSMAIEVEASSFSVWNCVITFLQILLMSTILYGAGWNQELNGITSLKEFDPNSPQYRHFRAIAFFFSIWALQSVALALLLVWGVGKRSYHLCHSWIVCEVLMQLFIVISGIYFTYHSYLTNNGEAIGGTTNAYRWSSTITSSSPSKSIAAEAALAKSNGEEYGVRSVHHYENGFRPPKHLVFLIILHFLIKGFGFWIIRRYMKLLESLSAEENGNDIEGGAGGAAAAATRASPPPSYDGLSIDDLPCYDEALKLCLKDNMKNGTPPHMETVASPSNQNDSTKSTSKSPLVPTVV